VVHVSNINTQINLLCILSFFYEIGNNFGGNSSNSGKIFTLQKKIFGIVASAQTRTSYSSLFKQIFYLLHTNTYFH